MMRSARRALCRGARGLDERKSWITPPDTDLNTHTHTCLYVIKGYYRRCRVELDDDDDAVSLLLHGDVLWYDDAM